MHTDDQYAQAVAAAWLADLAAAVDIASVDGVVACIHPHGWLRDLLTFTWDFRTRHGHDAIRSYLEGTLADAHIFNMKLEESEFGKPHRSDLGPGKPTVEAALTFETPKAHGRGYVRILCGDGVVKPTAICLMLMISDWKGHEEASNESGIYGGHTLAWFVLVS